MTAALGHALRWGALLALLLAGSVPAADIAYLSGRVTDGAEVLSPAARGRLTAALKAHEDATGNQVAVLTVPTLGGESVEGYATRVFEAWKLGQKGKDNGVLVLVVPQDRKMRIEVGYGLEGTLTDVAASRIIRNVMTPQFKDGNYDKGVEDGVAAVIGALEGKPVDAAAPASAKRGLEKSFTVQKPDMSWQMRLLVGAFVFGIIGLFTVIGVMTPGMGWFLYVFLIPFWAMFPLFVLGLNATVVVFLIYVIGYPIAKLILARSPWYEKAARDLKATGRANIGGFTITSGGSSSSGSSGFSSSGSSDSFSGGGGDSGGGGASGSW